MAQCLFWNSKMVGLHAPHTKIWISNMREGRVYKIRGRLYKILRNAFKIMAQCLFWNTKIVRPPSKIWTSNTKQAEDVRNSSSVVQNSKKKSKILAQCLFWNSKMVGLHASTHQNLNFEYEGRKGVRNSCSVGQNCKKCVQNYDTMFIFKFENSGATLKKLNFEYQASSGWTKLELGCTELWEMRPKLWHRVYLEIGKWRCYMPPLPLPKLDWRILGKGRLYKIRA